MEFFQNTILNDTLHRTSPAAERFVKLVNEMIRTSHDCRENNAPVVFPTNILPTPTTAPQLDLPDLYPNRPEFTAPDSKSQLSAHLAESRRKIEHLEERIDVVESALNAAIGELEKVHKHRLLGPILKAGEKIISIRDSVLHNKSKDINGSKKSRSTETT